MKLLFLLLIFSTFCKGSTTCEFSFSAVHANNPIAFNQYFETRSGDSVKITSLRFYISSIQLLKGSEIIFKEADSYHLIDLSERNSSITIHQPENTFDKIKFNLGIDSVTNNSGALGGDLDPTRAMYWSWQSGYINFKMEGVSPLCQGNHEFEYHLGGYAFPYNALREIILSLKSQSSETIVFDIDEFISQVNLSEKSHIMSPGKDAMDYSTIAARCFHLRNK